MLESFVPYLKVMIVKIGTREDNTPLFIGLTSPSNNYSEFACLLEAVFAATMIKFTRTSFSLRSEGASLKGTGSVVGLTG